MSIVDYAVAVPRAHTAVQALLTKPRRWPGGWSVVPAYGFRVGGAQTATRQAFARRQVEHDQSAANFAAAADTLTGTVEDWLLSPGQAYQVYAGFKIDSGVTAGAIGVDTASISPSEASVGGFAATRYSLVRIGSSAGITFLAGETITVRAYRSSGTGKVYLDQLYFVPVGVVWDSATGSDVNALRQTDIAGFADLGPSAASVSDAALASTGNAVRDTQVIDHLFDPDMRFSAWAASFDPTDFNIAENDETDFEARWLRHLYVSARVHDATYDGFTQGTWLSVLLNSGEPRTAHIFNTSGGFYYLGLVPYFFTPEQFVLWRSSLTAATTPFGFDYNDLGADADDVRVGIALFSTSYLDGDEVGQSPIQVPPSTQPNYPDADAQGIAVSFDSDTHAQPVWTRLDEV